MVFAKCQMLETKKRCTNYEMHAKLVHLEGVVHKYVILGEGSSGVWVGFL